MAEDIVQKGTGTVKLNIVKSQGLNFIHNKYKKNRKLIKAAV